MKVLKIGIVLALLFACIVWAISSFLGPDDLSACGERPDPSQLACIQADAIVAASGGDTAARADEAIKLYQNG